MGRDRPDNRRFLLSFYLWRRMKNIVHIYTGNDLSPWLRRFYLYRNLIQNFSDVHFIVHLFYIYGTAEPRYFTRDALALCVLCELVLETPLDMIFSTDIHMHERISGQLLAKASSKGPATLEGLAMTVRRILARRRFIPFSWRTRLTYSNCSMSSAQYHLKWCIRFKKCFGILMKYIDGLDLVI